MRFLLIFLAFNFIIIIHEMGHFLAARMVGMAVNEFSLFIGPKIFSFVRGGTTYTLRCLPIMAYVKLEGEEEKSDSSKSYNSKPIWARAFVIFAGPFANIATAFVLAAIVFSYAGYSTTTITEVANDSPAKIAGIMPGDTIVGYDNNSTYINMDVIQFLYISKGEPTTIKIRRGQEEPKDFAIIPTKIPAQYVLGVEILKNTEITGFSEKSSAEKAGMLVGDKIQQINNKKVSNIEELREILNSNKEKPMSVMVLRGEKEEVFTVTPKMNNESYSLGVGFSRKDGGVLESIKEGAVFTYAHFRNVGFTLKWLIQGKVKFDQMMGPVGIVSTMDSVVKQSESVVTKILSLVYMTSIFSVAIGATNLIPFPALDGSKLLLLCIETIRRKPLTVEKEAMISLVGFVLLIVFFMFVLKQDMVRLFM